MNDKFLHGNRNSEKPHNSEIGNFLKRLYDINIVKMLKLRNFEIFTPKMRLVKFVRKSV